jgi:hypothetical protein
MLPDGYCELVLQFDFDILKLQTLEMFERIIFITMQMLPEIKKKEKKQQLQIYTTDLSFSHTHKKIIKVRCMQHICTDEYIYICM